MNLFQNIHIFCMEKKLCVSCLGVLVCVRECLCMCECVVVCVRAKYKLPIIQLYIFPFLFHRHRHDVTIWKWVWVSVHCICAHVSVRTIWRKGKKTNMKNRNMKKYRASSTPSRDSIHLCVDAKIERFSPQMRFAIGHLRNVYRTVYLHFYTHIFGPQCMSI